MAQNKEKVVSHTKAPWRLRLVSDECSDYFVIEMADARRSAWQPQHRIEYPDGGTVQESHPEQFAESQANARLISAAPDLFSACEDLIKVATALGYNGGSITRAHLAMAKAKGE